MFQVKSLKYFLPLLVFLLMGFFLWRGLSNDPTLIPSTFLDKPMPAFRLPLLEDNNTWLTDQDIRGKITLFNVWATWCVSCRVEHPVLMNIAEQSDIQVVGLNYRDQRDSALAWLNQHGNPYTINLFDTDGRAAINWGIYGTPETFLLDAQGIIRYRHVGVIDETVWQDVLLPKIASLKEQLK